MTTEVKEIVSPALSNKSSSDVAEQYNKIADAYTTSLSEKFWKETRAYTFTKFVMEEGGGKDTLRGATILDLGCGSGEFSRWAMTQGASRVVGMDISEQQIALAKKLGEKQARDLQLLAKMGEGPPPPPMKQSYLVRDASTLESDNNPGEFDTVFAVHLLCYCQNREEMRRMLLSAASRLREGGRLFGVSECLSSTSKGKAPERVFGEIKGGLMFSYEMMTKKNSDEQQQQQHPQDFCPCKLFFRKSDQITYGFTTFPVHESTLGFEALTETGFRVNWIGLRLTCSPEGRSMFPPNVLHSLTEDYGRAMCYYAATKL